MSRSSQRVSLNLNTPQEPSSPSRLASWYTPGLSDAFGDRLLMFDNSSTAGLELLRFKPEFGDRREFEAALRQRVEALAAFRHDGFARSRAVERIGEADELALVSSHVTGRRLSELLRDARGLRFAQTLIEQLIPALAALQSFDPNLAHGVLNADRIIVTPEGRLVIVEHALGSALQALHLSPDRLRSEFGLMVPPGYESRAHDPQSDVIQVGYLALALALGRRVDHAEDPRRLVRLAAPQSDLGRWLERALRVDGYGFESAADAERALEPGARHRVGGRAPVATPPREARPPIDPPRRAPVPPPPPPPMPPPRVEARRPAPAPMPAEPPEFPSERGSATIFEFRDPKWSRPTHHEPTPSAWRWNESAPATEAEAPVPHAVPNRARRTIAVLATIAVAQALVIAGLLLPGLLRRPAEAPAATAAGPAAAAAGAVVTAPAQIEITAAIPGTRVTIDGEPKGVAPITLSVAPGTHRVEIASGTTVSQHVIDVAPGGLVTLGTR